VSAVANALGVSRQHLSSARGKAPARRRGRPPLPEEELAESPSWEVPSWDAPAEEATSADSFALGEDPTFALPDQAPDFEGDAPPFTASADDALESDPVTDFSAEGPLEEMPASFEMPDDEEEEKKEGDRTEQAASPEPAAAAAEDFADVRAFGEQAAVVDAGAEANPAFSVIAHGVRFQEDADEILEILAGLGFPSDMGDQFKRQLERGTLLVPRVSEYTAIHLCHRLRRFHLELQVGPSDLLHGTRDGADSAKGLVSRRSLAQNQHHSFRFNARSPEARDILLSTLPHLDGHVIRRYLGVASEHALVPAEQVEDETDRAIHATYDELASRLKGHALDKAANAVVGVNYQLTPLPAGGAFGGPRYRLTCTGNLVWADPMNP